MEPIKPEVMIQQARDLPTLTRQQTHRFDEKVRQALSIEEMKTFNRVFVTGDGDSYHAARAEEMVFENIACLPCEPMSAQQYLDYGAEWMPVNGNDTLLIAISSSGRTERGLQSLARGVEYGALTLALTGTIGSPFVEASERAVVVDVPDFGRSPGIRTYNASLMGLILIALRIGHARGRYDDERLETMLQEVVDLANVMEATLEAVEGPTKEAARDFQDSQMMIWLGSGPSYGTALFSAAKVVEAAGVFAVGQDLEEWAHVERFVYPDNMPVIIIAPPGRSHWRAIKLAEEAKKQGRRIGAVIQDGDNDIAKHADFIFPVMGEVREELSPLVYHIPSSFFAAYLTQNLGRMLFQTDRRGGW